MLDDAFHRANFETSTDLQALCARLAEVLTSRMRAAKNPHMEVAWIVAALRAAGHDVKHWDGVIANWEHHDDPELWVCLQGVDLDDATVDPDARVSVAFRPRLPGPVAHCCPLCASPMAEQEIWLKIEGHGSATAPGLLVHFECPGLPTIVEVVGTASVERRRSARVCTACGAALLLPR